ncbi:MAG: two component LuxR family transcriptional regulator [Bacillota bacterium]|nr:MAG: two component LuxR family transcriptional regulator [Bacillota bacterium]
MRVLIVDDDALMRDGLSTLLALEEDFEVCGTAENGQEAYHQCQVLRPDVVLMDIRMPVMDGVLSTKLIKQDFGQTKVVILTTFKDEDYVREAINNGAEGYILKSQSFASIVESLRVVCRGNTVYERAVAHILHSVLRGERKRDPAAPMSFR